MPDRFTIAIELEGVLISNAVGQFPRPVSRVFVSACREAGDRVEPYTSGPADRAADIVAGFDPTDATDAVPTTLAARVPAFVSTVARS